MPKLAAALAVASLALMLPASAQAARRPTRSERTAFVKTYHRLGCPKPFRCYLAIVRVSTADPHWAFGTAKIAFRPGSTQGYLLDFRRTSHGWRVGPDSPGSSGVGCQMPKAVIEDIVPRYCAGIERTQPEGLPRKVYARTCGSGGVSSEGVSEDDTTFGGPEPARCVIESQFQEGQANHAKWNQETLSAFEAANPNTSEPSAGEVERWAIGNSEHAWGW